MMPENKMIRVEVTMPMKQLRTLVAVIGASYRMHEGQEYTSVIRHTMMMATKKDEVKLVWDLFTKILVDAQLAPPKKQALNELITDIPVLVRR